MHQDEVSPKVEVSCPLKMVKGPMADDYRRHMLRRCCSKGEGHESLSMAGMRFVPVARKGDVYDAKHPRESSRKEDVS